MKIRLPLGIDNFKKLREAGYYYVDKTGFIAELLRNPPEASLITRPRRFGKTLTLSMLEDFFDIRQDSRGRFLGLEIMREPELCEHWMNQWPVLFLSFKSVEGLDFKGAAGMMANLLSDLCISHKYLEESEKIDSADRKFFEDLKLKKADTADIKNALYVLMRMMYACFGRPVILLVDEYDVLLAKANECGYYKEMLDLIRGMLGKALKTNEYLKFSVIMGCLKIAKESIFTGINHLVADTVTGQRFEEYFGFTQKDVEKLLGDCGLTEYNQVIKDWYDGYHFGAVDVYCPWDALRYSNDLMTDSGKRPEAYWANTSENRMIRNFIRRANKSIRREIELLMDGRTISKEISEELTYADMDEDINNIWSILLTTGYLTQQGQNENGSYRLVIPNREIHKIFADQIMRWFQDEALKKPDVLEMLFSSLQNGDAQGVKMSFDSLLATMISIRDTYSQKVQKENFYHGMLLGLLRSNDNWIVQSNAESGIGYCDIRVEIEEKETGIIIEVKYAEKDALDSHCAEAMRQIEEKQYAEGLAEDGMKKIYLYGIACYKKHCQVVCRKYCS